MPSVDWIKETMTRGMSSHTLHYTVAPNDSYDGRKAEIIYRDKSDSNIADTLTVMQAQKDAIIISEKEVKVGSEGGIVEVKIDANVDFEMQLPDIEWISESSTRGLSTHKKYLKIAENTGETSRTAEVVFKNTMLQRRLRRPVMMAMPISGGSMSTSSKSEVSFSFISTLVAPGFEILAASSAKSSSRSAASGVTATCKASGSVAQLLSAATSRPSEPMRPMQRFLLPEPSQ